jgi:hypothetical protein
MRITHQALKTIDLLGITVRNHSSYWGIRTVENV